MDQKLNKKPSYHRPIRILLLFILLMAFLGLTQPEELPLVFLLIPFVLIYLLFYQLGYLLITKANPRKSRKFVVGSSASLATLPTVILLLSSLNQLSGVDLAVVLLLITGVFMYIQYVDFFKSQ